MTCLTCRAFRGIFGEFHFGQGGVRETREGKVFPFLSSSDEKREKKARRKGSLENNAHQPRRPAVEPGPEPCPGDVHAGEAGDDEVDSLGWRNLVAIFFSRRE